MHKVSCDASSFIQEEVNIMLPVNILHVKGGHAFDYVMDTHPSMGTLE